MTPEIMVGACANYLQFAINFVHAALVLFIQLLAFRLPKQLLD